MKQFDRDPSQAVVICLLPFEDIHDCKRAQDGRLIGADAFRWSLFNVVLARCGETDFSEIRSFKCSIAPVPLQALGGVEFIAIISSVPNSLRGPII